MAGWRASWWRAGDFDNEILTFSFVFSAFCSVSLGGLSSAFGSLNVPFLLPLRGPVLDAFSLQHVFLMGVFVYKFVTYHNITVMYMYTK